MTTDPKIKAWEEHSKIDDTHSFACFEDGWDAAMKEAEIELMNSFSIHFPKTRKGLENQTFNALKILP